MRGVRPLGLEAASRLEEERSCPHRTPLSPHNPMSRQPFQPQFSQQVPFRGSRVSISFSSITGTVSGFLQLVSGSIFQTDRIRVGAVPRVPDDDAHIQAYHEADPDFDEGRYARISRWFKLGGALLAFGYFVYRYFYVRRREKELDFVDVAMLKRY